MNLKKKLSQLQGIKKEIKEQNKRIAEYRSNLLTGDIAVGSSSYFPYQERRFKIEGINLEIQKKIDSLIEKIKKNELSLINIVHELEEYIATLENGRMRRILRFRYIDNKKWISIALEMGGQSTDDSVRKEHDRFLKQ